MSNPSPDMLAALLTESCVAAWNEEIQESDCEPAALEAASIAIEDYLAEQNLPRHLYSARDVAIAALNLTPAELQSIPRWCPGHGDDVDCEIDSSNPCAGCRDAGFRVI